MAKFIPGLKLSKAFYRELIAPEISRRWPNLQYSAGLLGWGSDVLGMDTHRSMDHMWGPRLLLFFNEVDNKRYSEKILQQLGKSLPSTFRGYSVHFGSADAAGVRHQEYTNDVLVNPLIEIYTPRSLLGRYLGIDSLEGLALAKWLKFSEQALVELTSGEIFHDDLNQINTLRNRLSYYPHDVWLHKLAHAWQALVDEVAFGGRCHELKDNLGWRIIAARQTQRLMYLCFLLERTYAPYSKWFASAFKRKLRAARYLGPILENILKAQSWPQCEEHLVKAYEYVARKHNRLGICEPQPAKVSCYFGRPYKVLWADKFANATKNAITDTAIKKQTHTQLH